MAERAETVRVGAGARRDILEVAEEFISRELARGGALREHEEAADGRQWVYGRGWKRRCWHVVAA